MNNTLIPSRGSQLEVNALASLSLDLADALTKSRDLFILGCMLFSVRPQNMEWMRLPAYDTFLFGRRMMLLSQGYPLSRIERDELQGLDRRSKEILGNARGWVRDVKNGRITHLTRNKGDEFFEAVDTFNGDLHDFLKRARCKGKHEKLEIVYGQGDAHTSGGEDDCEPGKLLDMIIALRKNEGRQPDNQAHHSLTDMEIRPMGATHE